MITKTVTIINETGLHARPASTLVGMVRNLDCKIKLINGDIIADAKSIINIMTINAKKGTEITIECEGPDELEALEMTSKFLAEFTD